MLTLLCAVALGFQAAGSGETVTVQTATEFRAAVAAAKPGTKILLSPGDYPGGFHFSGLHGTPEKPIVIGASDPKNPPRLVGGSNGMQLSSVSYLELRDITVKGATGNGLNIDDGSTLTKPSHHLTLRNVHVSDLPQGNRDGIKLSGVDDFRVESCTVERWGGSGIDMVGCHRGVIVDSTFRTGGSNAIQCKGGTSEIRVQRCRFENPGERGVNIGGSTGLQFFRPPISSMPASGRYEAKEITVEGCVFVGGTAPIAFVGVDGATVRFNTIYHPTRWAARILQETKAEGFVPCRNGVFEDNLVVFRSDMWFSGGLNVGGDTSPTTFAFRRNFWFCSDRPERSQPTLPTVEVNGTYGKDPLLRDPAKGDYGVRSGSPAARVGAHAFR